MGDTEGRNLDRMSTIYLLFSLRQKGFMRKDLKVTISLLSFFPLVDFGRAALSDDTKAHFFFFFTLCDRETTRFKGNRAVLFSQLVDLGKVLNT